MELVGPALEWAWLVDALKLLLSNVSAPGESNPTSLSQSPAMTNLFVFESLWSGPTQIHKSILCKMVHNFGCQNHTQL